MSKYQANAISNYFRVTDLDQFTAAMSAIGIEVRPRRRSQPKVVAIYPQSTRVGWSLRSRGRGRRDDVHENIVDFTNLVSRHLAKGSVAILMEVGNESPRFLLGYAVAVNAAGETRRVALFEINDLAQELGTDVDLL